MAFQDSKAYMVQKKRKLLEQFESSSSGYSSSDTSGGVKRRKIESDILKGLHVYVTGYTEPPLDELKILLYKHGGVYEQYMSASTVTHVIASNLPQTKVKEWAKKGIRQLKVVSPQWLVDSIKQKVLLPWTHYDIFRKPKNGGARSSLDSPDQKRGGKTGVSSLYRLQTSAPYSKPAARQPGIEQHSIVIPQERQSPRKGISSEISSVSPIQKVPPSRPPLPPKVSPSKPPRPVHPPSHSTTPHHPQAPRPPQRIPNAPQPQKQKPQPPLPKDRILTSENSGFLQQYYGQSRLHHLSTWKQQFRELLAQEIAQASSQEVLSQEITLSPSSPTGEGGSKGAPQRIICHIDLDSFFVSVAVRFKPALSGRAVAVCHSSAPRPSSTSEIACVSYEGRKYGIRNGMYVGQATKLCPTLELVPYEFKRYESISRMFYNVLLRFTKKIQVVSCDEAYLDLTGRENPEKIVLEIRKEIFETCGCDASAGIGCNILVARMACRDAKPKGQKFVPKAATENFIRDKKVSQLPGVGRHLMKKFQEMAIDNCEQLRRVPKLRLQTTFGKKLGEGLWSLCRGIDERPLVTDSTRKSIGAEVNWGVRFQEDSQVIRFLSEIVDEVVSRMKAAGYFGLRVTVKAKKAKPGVTPMKHGGHGPCFNFSKSFLLPQFTQHAPTILPIAKDLYQQLSIPPAELRGLGVHLSQLRSEKEVDENPIPPVAPSHQGEAESLRQNNLMKWATKQNKAEKAEVEGEETMEEDFGGRLSVSQVFRPKGVFQHPRRSRSRKEEKEEVEDEPSFEDEIDLPENLSQIDLDVLESLPSPLRRKVEKELGSKRGGGSTSSKDGGKKKGGEGLEGLPNLSQIDLSVVDSLPLPLRREIESEYRQQLKQKHGARGKGREGRQRTLGEIGCHIVENEDEPQGGETEEQRETGKQPENVRQTSVRNPGPPKEVGGNLTSFLLSSNNPAGVPPSTSCTAPVLFFHSEEVDVVFRERVRMWMKTTSHPSPLQKAMLLLFSEQLALEGSLEGLEFLIKFLVSFAQEFPQWGGVVGGVVEEVQEVVCGLYGCCLDVEVPGEWKEEESRLGF